MEYCTERGFGLNNSMGFSNSKSLCFQVVLKKISLIIMALPLTPHRPLPQLSTPILATDSETGDLSLYPYSAWHTPFFTGYA